MRGEAAAFYVIGVLALWPLIRIALKVGALG